MAVLPNLQLVIIKDVTSVLPYTLLISYKNPLPQETEITNTEQCSCNIVVI